MQAARQEGRDAQATREATRLVCIDETWAAPNLTRRYGRAPRGARRVVYAPHGHWKPTTVVAAWRHTGIAAPRVAADPINGALCLKEVQECLGPALAPGDSVMLDHLSAHPGAGGPSMRCGTIWTTSLRAPGGGRQRSHRSGWSHGARPAS
jgi:DDE superfamily endonuclease